MIYPYFPPAEADMLEEICKFIFFFYYIAVIVTAIVCLIKFWYWPMKPTIKFVARKIWK